MAKLMTASRWIVSKKFARSDLYCEVPTWQRPYGIPFALVYAVWFIGWLKLRSLEQVPSWLMFREFYLIPLFLTASTHFVMYMCRFWSVTANAWMSFRKVSIVKEADKILVVPIENYGKAGLCTIIHGEESTFFYFQQRKFVYDPEKNIFVKLQYPECNQLSLYKSSQGLDDEQVHSSTVYYDKNEFKIPIPTFVELWKEHAVAPFFVFQVFCVGLWLLDDYWYYSLFTLFMLCVFESTVVYQRLRNIKDFQTMSIPLSEVFVKRGGRWLQIQSSELVPGDMCSIKYSPDKESTCPCDLLLLSGSCIVNEAMLSGESTPLLKESINELGDNDSMLELKIEHRNYVLFGGTKILQLTPSDNLSSFDPRTMIPMSYLTCSICSRN
jgi:cation-transporting ATPase 13A1